MVFPPIYKDKDADLQLIANKRIGIIGFGNQGRAQALNLQDSGINVCIGLRGDSKSREEVEKENITCLSIQEIVESSHIISILVPDQVMGEVYNEFLEPNLKDGQTLLFSHGYNIHYRVIQPPEYVNILLAAPSGPGTELRKRYIEGNGIPGLFAVHQDYSSDAEGMALAYCKAIGLTRSGVVKSTFMEETETDLFGEQVILTGGIPKMIQSSYKVLLEYGYSPGIAWLVCYYEMKTIVDMFHSKGFEFMNSAISDTAEYGGITRGRRIIDEEVENKMRIALEEIQSGKFHAEWMKEYDDGYPLLEQLRKEEKNLNIGKISKYMLKELFGEK